MLHQVSVKGLTLDPLTNTPILLLRDAELERTLPIWVAVPEANAIVMELEDIVVPRPMTHDLLRDVISQLEGSVTRVVVHDVKDNTFYAEIHIVANGANLTLDSRPSDAIALALRTGSPIFVHEGVFTKTGQSVERSHQHWDDQDQVREWLDALSPGDFEQEHL